MTGVLLLLVGGLLVVKGLRDRQPWIRWTAKVPLRAFLKALGAVVASVTAYILLTPVLGFPVVALVILSLLFQVYYRRGWVLSVSIAGISTAAIWGLFAQMLYVPLEPGLLEWVLYP